MERLVAITGLSGSGKTLAANCLEDLGYFCVDNLPVQLIPPFYELIQRSAEQLLRAALVIDVREGAFLDSFPDILGGLRERGAPVQLLFLESSDEVLKRRFSESRRPHPMAKGKTLEEAIRTERAALERLRDAADRIIDTSRFTAHELRSFMQNAYGLPVQKGLPSLNLVSFGFKYGLPAEADLVFDVRFLPNPYFVDGLRHLDGRTSEVRRFLDQSELTSQFAERVDGLLRFLIPLYGAEGKTYLTVAIGCTGGKHRSVALAERIGERLSAGGLPVSVSHRDLGRE
jgi:UPF0042 nucleotide-binding protein